MVEKATDVAALTKLFSPSNASDAPRKRTTEAPRKNPLARPNRVLFSVISRRRFEKLNPALPAESIRTPKTLRMIATIAVRLRRSPSSMKPKRAIWAVSVLENVFPTAKFLNENNHISKKVKKIWDSDPRIRKIQNSVFNPGREASEYSRIPTR